MNGIKDITSVQEEPLSQVLAVVTVAQATLAEQNPGDTGEKATEGTSCHHDSENNYSSRDPSNPGTCLLSTWLHHFYFVFYEN